MKRLIILAMVIAVTGVFFTGCDKKDSPKEDKTINITEENAEKESEKLLKEIDNL